MIELEITRTEKVEVQFLKAIAEVRYWEDATVNGIEDSEGDLIPCRVGDCWAPTIDLDTGVIQDWPADTIADIHYKVCDAGRYALLDAEGNKVKEIDGYVPGIMCPVGGGYGDYIIMHVGPVGNIANWDCSDLGEFTS